MTDHLKRLLDAEGYAERAPQRALYEHIRVPGGVVAQAGTGVGKSIAVLAAAGYVHERTGRQSLIVTPTRVLMDQYMAHDAPLAGKTFGLEVAELRGMSHYFCEQTRHAHEDIMGRPYELGCDGQDVGCSEDKALGRDESPGYDCEYQEAKAAAKGAAIVITNTDFLLINDTILAPIDAPIFDPQGFLLVDEAHQFEPKMRDYASRSLNAQRLEKFSTTGKMIAEWIRKVEKLDDPKFMPRRVKEGLAEIGRTTPSESDSRQRRETRDAAQRITRILEDQHPDCLIYVADEAIKMDWANVARSAGQLLRNRGNFALVSATVPQSMASSLGVPEAPYVDVGHPFDYSKQVTAGISSWSGAFKFATDKNFDARLEEVRREVMAARGGALILFSSYRDLDRAWMTLLPELEGVGLTVLRQGAIEGEEPMPNDEIARRFKEDGNAVLFASESFATGFDCPGDALRLVVLWKLPYPGQSPVNEVLRKRYFQRYNDGMRVKAVQGIGRLIRTTSDRGRVYVADERGAMLFSNANDPLTGHLAAITLTDSPPDERVSS